MKSRRYKVGWNVLLALALLLGGCGGGSGNEEQGTGGGAARVVPTMPAARFAQPTMVPTVDRSSSVTETVAVATATPEAATGPDLARGETVYRNRNCAECHGAAAEGVADKGNALAGTTLSEAEFNDIMRTGAQGRLGPSHNYGPSAISPGGMVALHAWLQSLEGGR
jgi:mono/diheme cytochrome c family protein